MAKEEYDLKIWLPGSIVLLGIGFFTIATPFFTQLDHQSLLLDLISGGLLIAIGCIGLLIGRSSQKKGQSVDS
ncbi:hypothetical protein GF407_05190 [candidate division KSB1 bacterium]|nr:hypothetical protein [candidate division KSB1 bacterium]